MIPATDSIVAITLAEWYAWTTAGLLRLHGTRLTRLSGTDDEQGFADLMASAPDVSVSDDHAHLLAHLLPEAWAMAKPQSPLTSEYPLQAVRSFEPLTERASRILEGDACRARVSLAEPVHEALWREWSRRQRESRADGKGLRVARALGLGEPPVRGMDGLLFNRLAGLSDTPHAERRTDYVATMAWAWAEAFAITRDLDESALPKAREGLKAFLNSLRMIHDLSRPVLPTVDEIMPPGGPESLFAEIAGMGVSIGQLACIRHYTELRAREKPVGADALAEDLLILGLRSAPSMAATAAYFIGRQLSDEQATTIVAVTSPDAHPALRPEESGHPWHVGERMRAARSVMPPASHQDEVPATEAVHVPRTMPEGPGESVSVVANAGDEGQEPTEGPAKSAAEEVSGVAVDGDATASSAERQADPVAQARQGRLDLALESPEVPVDAAAGPDFESAEAATEPAATIAPTHTVAAERIPGRHKRK